MSASAALIIATSASGALAEELSSSATNGVPAGAVPDLWNWHVQNTDMLQGHPSFRSPYSGPQSLLGRQQINQTESLDLFFGLRLWPGAEVHADALVWQGFGLSHTLGVAGFLSGEAFKTGTEIPNITFAHLFVQQTFGLGGETETIPDGQLQLAKEVDVSRITVFAGKLNAKDYFDVSSYANDARTQFLNWALVANGAWDYPADSLGYIPGAVVDWHEKDWSFRYGAFQEPRVANGAASDPHFLEAWGMVLEAEHRHQWNSHPGAVKVLTFLNRANMGNYNATLENPGLGGDVSQTRKYRYKYGFGLNAEQELTRDLGVFARFSWNDGKNESWAYTDIDQSASLGLSLKGTVWSRPEDTVGVAGVMNAISGGHSGILAAGGNGILLGDGALHYGTERIIETYYDCHVWKTVHLAADFQYVVNPGYNRDRGPVPVFAARLHWEL